MNLKNLKNIFPDILNHRISTVKYIFCAALLLPVSCNSFNITEGGNGTEQVKAENRIMKKNLMLALRENSVLKDENIQYKDENSRQKTKITLLESEMESLKKKYEQDIALLNEKYDNLNRKNLILEQESSSKIQELTAVNKALEGKMAVEITRLNENIRRQEETFNKERAEIETAFTAKELEYQKQLAQLKKDILTATMELESVKLKLAESESGLASAKSEMAKKDELNRDLQLKIDSLNAEKLIRKEDSPEIKSGNP